MNEDDLYRTSSQYRFWTYTERALSELRSTSNKQASSRVRDAIKRSRAKDGQPTSDSTEIACLTVEEEQKIIKAYCFQAMEFCDFANFSKAVKATAVQFLKRFYLSSSPMTYHPKEMMLSAVFLATKVENINMTTGDFTSLLPNVKADAVLAPEFLLTQGLRFTFDVRHPYRGLEGGTMQLTQMARGEYMVPAGSKLTSGKVKERVLSIEGYSGSSRPATMEQFSERLKKAYGKAKDILTKGALLTDAYFLYTPSQIWMSALLAADKALAEIYLHIILSGTSGEGSEPSALEIRLKGVLEQCATLMTLPSSWRPDEAEQAESKRIGKKLFKCQNPEKADIVAMSKAAKEGLNGTEDEKIIKKRKIERERAVKEEQDVFGAPLKK